MSRSRQSGKIVNLINSQQTYMVLTERRWNPPLFPPARLPSCLGWGVRFQSACWAQCRTETYCSHCPLKCRLLFQTRPANLPLAHWNPNSLALFRNETTPNLPNRSQTRGLMSCCYLHLIYNSSTIWVYFVLGEYLCPRTKSSSARRQKTELFSCTILSLGYCQSRYFTSL